MAFWLADRLQRQGGRVPGLTMLTRRGSALQSIIIGAVVGAVLGIYMLEALALPQRLVPLSILAVLCPFIALVVGNVRRLLLAIILLDIPFGLDMYFFSRYGTGELVGIGGLNISATTIALIGLYAVWLGESLGRKKHQIHPRVWTSTTFALAAYVALTALSVVVARDAMLAFFEIFLLVQTFLLYIYIVATVRTRQDVLFIVTMLLIGLLLESLVMIGLVFVGHNITVAGITGVVWPGPRVAGTVGSPNTAAGYLTLFLAPAMGMLLTRLGRPYKWLAMLAFGLGVVALVLTLSRGGWIAFVLSMTILCLLAWRRGWLSLSVPLVVAFCLLVVALLFQDTISARISGEEASKPETRFLLMELAWRIIKDHPVLGVGANNFPLLIEEYATPEFGSTWLYIVHNKFLLIWAEAGTGAIIAFLLFLFTTIRSGWQCWKFNDRLLSPLALGFTAGIVGHMSQMFVEIFKARPQVQSLWLVAGLITAMGILVARGSTMPRNEQS